MFVCKACARRASTSVLRQLPNADIRLATLPRQFVTSSFLRKGQDQEDGFAQFEASVERQKTPEDREVDKKKALERSRRAMKKELQYTTDPYHIAENVVKKLKENDFDKALLLTREASKDKQCVVSWNHCIEYQFKNNKLHAAIKLFNEVGDLWAKARSFNKPLFLEANPAADEKASPTSKRANIHHYFQRLRRVRASKACCRRGAQDLQHHAVEQPTEAQRHTSQRGPGCLFTSPGPRVHVRHTALG